MGNGMLGVPLPPGMGMGGINMANMGIGMGGMGMNMGMGGMMGMGMNMGLGPGGLPMHPAHHPHLHPHAHALGNPPLGFPPPPPASVQQHRRASPLPARATGSGRVLGGS